MGCFLRTFGAFALCAFGILFPMQASFGQTLTVAATPSSLTIYPGQQNVPIAVTVGSSTSYAGPISVTLTGLPSGITVSPLTLTAGSTGNLSLSASGSAGQEGFPNTYPSLNTSWTAKVSVVAAAGSAQATSPLSLTVSISNSSFAPAQAAINLPIVAIDTNGVPIVDKTTDISGTITITSADGQTSYLPNSSDSDNTGNFHLHGSSTTDMPKLSYHVKLTTSLDLLNVMGLSCPYVTSGKAKPTCDKSKSYILLANYCDKTMLHDWAASALANAIPIGNGYLGSPANSPTPTGTSNLMPWAAHSLFVELYLNGVYEGTYQLIEQVKVDSHRVNINELAETDISDDITGGYLLEFDQHEDEAFVFFTPQGLPVGLTDPDFTPDPEVPQQTAYISNYVDGAETALFSSKFTDPTQGWRAYFDEASAVNFYIVNDLMGNVDGGRFYSSTYMYKDKDNPLLYMGPIWDFDISSGNVNYATIVNPTVPWMQEQSIWYQQWLKDPGFKADLVTQWNALKNNGVFAAWMASIQQQGQSLEQSQANNFSRWPMLGMEVWPNPEAAGNYDGEVQYTMNWLQLRFEYLDSVINNKTQTSTSLTIGAGSPRVGSPVTLTAQVTGGSAPTGVVSFLSNGVVLGSGALSNGKAVLATSNLQAGSNQIQAVYNGDTTNGLSASTSQALNVAAALMPVVVSVGGPATAGLGSPASFSAAVIPNFVTVAPSGTVSFSVDGSSGTSETLGGVGAASYSTTSLALGAHTITAVYSGDANYGTASGSTSVTVIIAPGLTLSGAAVTVLPGASSGNTSTITLTPVYGFTGSVSLSAALASGPAGASYPPTFSFGASSPVNITSASAKTATLTVFTTAASSASLAHPDGPGLLWHGVGGTALACVLFFGIAGGRRRRRSMLGMLILLAFLGGGVVSCGGGSGSKSGNLGTTAGTYTATVTAVSGSITALTTVQVVVQ